MFGCRRWTSADQGANIRVVYPYYLNRLVNILFYTIFHDDLFIVTFANDFYEQLPSTISGAGFGLFATTDIEKGATITELAAYFNPEERQKLVNTDRQHTALR